MAKICIKKATTKCEMDDFVRLHASYETASFYIN